MRDIERVELAARLAAQSVGGPTQFGLLTFADNLKALSTRNSIEDLVEQSKTLDSLRKNRP